LPKVKALMSSKVEKRRIQRIRRTRKGRSKSMGTSRRSRKGPGGQRTKKGRHPSIEDSQKSTEAEGPRGRKRNTESFQIAWKRGSGFLLLKTSGRG